MTGLLQTRIELDMQQQNADLLASLNHAAERQCACNIPLKVSTVAISYYLVNLLRAPADWFWHASQRSTLLRSISAWLPSPCRLSGSASGVF